jgi:hypothetical protein
VLIRESRGGLLSGAKEFDTVGEGFAHSSLMLVGSSTPRMFEEGRELIIREGAWISEYAVVASRPAYFWITGDLRSVRGLYG